MSKSNAPFETELTVNHNDAGRLDAFLAKSLANELSRTRAQELIVQGDVLVNGSTSKASYKVKQGDSVFVRIPPPTPWDVVPQDIPLNIVYEDDEILIINKERGMVVHPAAGHWEGTLVNAILAHCPDLCGIGGEERPGIVHRLDKDTTGLMVVAKSQLAMRVLQEEIKSRRVNRQYVALVKGALRTPRGTVDAPIGRNPYQRKKMAVVPSGKPAVTDFEVLANFGKDYTLIMAKLRTGRTHQIRVHMAHLKHPVVGDPVYSRNKGELGLTGQALHAARLGLIKPSTGQYLEFKAPLPWDFAQALCTLKEKYKEDVPQWLMSQAPDSPEREWHKS